MVGLCPVGLVVLLQFNCVDVLARHRLAGPGCDLSLHEALSPTGPRWCWDLPSTGARWSAGRQYGAGSSGRRSRSISARSLWTIAYDTIYAHQDKEDDLALGLKSTAIRFGSATKTWLTAIYTAALVLWSVAAVLAGAGLFTAMALAAAGACLAWQVATLDIDDPANCLLRFKANRLVGWMDAVGRCMAVAERLDVDDHLLPHVDAAFEVAEPMCGR